jgi:hypothetical protein
MGFKFAGEGCDEELAEAVALIEHLKIARKSGWRSVKVGVDKLDGLVDAFGIKDATGQGIEEGLGNFPMGMVGQERGIDGLGGHPNLAVTKALAQELLDIAGELFDVLGVKVEAPGGVLKAAGPIAIKKALARPGRDIGKALGVVEKSALGLLRT